MPQTISNHPREIIKMVIPIANSVNPIRNTAEITAIHIPSVPG